MMVHEVGSLREILSCLIRLFATIQVDLMVMNEPSRSQGEEARVEGKILMRVQENIISPRNGNAIVGGFQDHIMGIYLLTKEV